MSECVSERSVNVGKKEEKVCWLCVCVCGRMCLCV